MSTIASSAAIVIADPDFSEAERFALAGFLAGYRGLTRDTYALDLRQFVAWCEQHGLRLFEVRRADIECFARDLEARSRARDGGPPAVHGGGLLPLRRTGRPAGALAGGARAPAPSRLRVPRDGLGPQRGRRPAGGRRANPRPSTRWSRCWRSTGGGSPKPAAPTSTPSALNGASDPDGVPKGGTVVTIPLAPRTAQAIDLAIGELRGTDLPRCQRRAVGPARRLAYRAPPRPQGGDHQAGRAAHAPARAHHRGPRRGRPARDVQKAASHADPRTTMRYDRGRVSLDRHATYIVAAFSAGAAR